MKSFMLAAICLIVLPSLQAQLAPIGSGVYHWDKLAVRKQPGREMRKLLEGSTPEFSFFEIHATTQLPGAEASPMHVQKDIEELIIVKEGILTCTIDGQTKELTQGSVLLIPPGSEQAVSNKHDKAVTYYVLMFRSIKPMDMARSEKAGGPLMLEASSLIYEDKGSKGAIKYFDRPTATCENFEMHITKLNLKGPSHNPHMHVDTEIILVNEGQVSMTIDGEVFEAGPGDLIIAKSNSLHGVSNASEEACSYFAFKWR